MPKKMLRLQMFTDTSLHMMLLQLMWFTDFVRSPEEQMYFSIVYVVAFALICLIYIVVIILNGIKQWKR